MTTETAPDHPTPRLTDVTDALEAPLDDVQAAALSRVLAFLPYAGDILTDGVPVVRSFGDVIAQLERLGDVLRGVADDSASIRLERDQLARDVAAVRRVFGVGRP